MKMSNMTNTTQTLLKVTGILAAYNPEFPLQTLRALLLIAANPGITFRELADKMDMVSSAATRNALILGSIPYKGKKAGLKLVSVTDDAIDRRVKHIELTSKGHLLIEQLGGELRSGSPGPNPALQAIVDAAVKDALAKAGVSTHI